MKDRVVSFLRLVDWPMLLLLIGATNVKLYIKLAAIVLYGGWMLYKKVRLAKPPAPFWFYMAMPVAGIISAGIQGAFSIDGYWYGLMFGTVQWVAAAAIFYLLFITVRSIRAEKVSTSIKAFFLLNALISLAQLGMLIIQSKHLMPYWYYDSGLKYGASTGDNIHGITANHSINNAVIGLLGVTYFLFRKEWKWSILCLFILLLCSSNAVIFFLLAILVVIFLFAGKQKVRRAVLGLVGFTCVIYPILSPQNLQYINTVYSHIVHPAPRPEPPPELDTIETVVDTESSPGVVLKMESRMMRAPRSNVPVRNSVLVRMREELINLKANSKRVLPPGSNVALDQNTIKEAMERWYGMPLTRTPLAYFSKPSKVFGIKQTVHFIKSSPIHFLLGAGIGNYSSKLAIKMTGLGLQGRYPDKHIYINRNYMEGHFYTMMYVLAQNVSEHSVINMPGNVYVQIAGEYGLTGIVLFLVLYLFWFWKRSAGYPAGRWMLFALLICFSLEYWFEMMSLTVIFELLAMQGIFAAQEEKGETALPA
jgi:hypothetical protein